MNCDLKRALDRVDFCRERANHCRFKKARIVRTWNLWAAEDIAQHIAEALQVGTVNNV